jgi:hypothetical protein
MSQPLDKHTLFAGWNIAQVLSPLPPGDPSAFPHPRRQKRVAVFELVIQFHNRA